MGAIKKLGAAMKYLDNSLYEEANTRIIVRKLDGKSVNQEKYMNPHAHDVNQIYLLIGDPGELAFEIHLDDEVYKVESPGTVFIPAGVKHWEKYLHGKGYIATILSKGTYP